MYILAAVTAGFILDFIFGDPQKIPHPVVLMGNVISSVEAPLRRLFPKTPRGEFLAGLVLALLLPVLSLSLSFAALYVLYSIHPVLGLVLESFWCFQIMAVKSLKDAGMRVFAALSRGNIQGARRQVSFIVGRDTDNLSEQGIIKATVETIAENTTDGSISPLLFMLLGGAPLGMLYKSINTMDSMIGYKNERYMYFGTAAAKLDDAANFIPARLAGAMMAAIAPLFSLDGRDAWRIFLRDRKNHKSPNSAHTEAACSGALGVQLAGDASYFGSLIKKPTIGDAKRPVATGDIVSAIKLLYGTSVFCFLIGFAVRLLIVLIL